MAKIRKAGGRPSGIQEPRNTNSEESKLRINTYEDGADSEDEFHINRDKILLEEGPAQKRQRFLLEEDVFIEPSDEEVLPEGDISSESDEDFEDAQEALEPTPKRNKPIKPSKPLRDTDSEASAAEDGEDVGGWGSSRKDYYNADIIETEADALEEEKEARRLQQKQLHSMTEEDFGFDEVDWLEAGKDDGDDGSEHGNVVREVLPKLEITDAMGPEERSKILATRYPEFEPLAKEFLGLQRLHEDLGTAATAALAVRSRVMNNAIELQEIPLPIAAVKHCALSAYLAALSMYFALLTSGGKTSGDKTAAMPPEQLRDHSVMETLVQCRDLWEKVKNTAVPEPTVEIPNGNTAEEPAIESSGLNGQVDEHDISHKRHKVRKTKTQRAAERAQAEASARRAERLLKTEEDLASLSALTAPTKKITKPKNPIQPLDNDDSDSDFGDQTALTPHEAAEKAQRKKSLRFYTSQIAQKSNKRSTAGRDAGGDADLPYRERLKDRQARLTTEAESRGHNPKSSLKGAPLGGASDDDDGDDIATARELRGEDGKASEEDYYDLITSRSASRKASKSALAAAHAQAEAESGIVRIVDPEISGDGKRAISYVIEKNKGLAPKRKKDVRNPRVKKRKKYEEKKKKLGSVRPVWKGGEGRGGYGGEKTGIKKGLVKSVKL